MNDDSIARHSADILRAFDFASEISAIQAAHRDRLTSIFRMLLPVIDSLDRCAAARDGLAPAAVEPATIKLIAQQLTQALESAGVSEVACLGEPVDPQRHEIVDVRETDETASEVIVQVLSRGYDWEGRPLRRPAVVVARHPKEA